VDRRFRSWSLAGGRLGPGSLGVLCEAMRFAPDAGGALRASMLYFHLHCRGASATLWGFGGSTVFGYTPVCPEAPGTVPIYGTALSIAGDVLTGLMAGNGGLSRSVCRVTIPRIPNSFS
jgi:hypothetical protein